MSGSRVLFKLDPSIVVAEWTEMGPGFDLRAPRRPLKDGACLAAFDAGIPYLRDIAGPDDRAHLVLIEDDDLLAAIDRERKVIDVEDLR